MCEQHGAFVKRVRIGSEIQVIRSGELSPKGVFFHNFCVFAQTRRRLSEKIERHLSDFGIFTL